MNVAFADARREAKAEGILEGISKGVAKGIAKGVIVGRNEKALETAKNLLKLNLLTLEQISSVVNIPIEQLKEIEKN